MLARRSAVIFLALVTTAAAAVSAMTAIGGIRGEPPGGSHTPPPEAAVTSADVEPLGLEAKAIAFVSLTRSASIASEGLERIDLAEVPDRSTSSDEALERLASQGPILVVEENTRTTAYRLMRQPIGIAFGEDVRLIGRLHIKDDQAVLSIDHRSSADVANCTVIWSYGDGQRSMTSSPYGMWRADGAIGFELTTPAEEGPCPDFGIRVDFWTRGENGSRE